MQLYNRKDGDEQPSWKAGPFRVRLPFVHYRWETAEMLQALTIAVVGEVPLERLWHAVPAYPTVSELWLRWLEAFGRPE